MIFTDLPAGAAVFVDANILVYHFSLHPQFGAACTALMDRIERRELSGFTTIPVLGETAHRLMTLEAIALLQWPAAAGPAVTLGKHGDLENLSGSQAKALRFMAFREVGACSRDEFRALRASVKHQDSVFGADSVM